MTTSSSTWHAALAQSAREGGAAPWPRWWTCSTAPAMHLAAMTGAQTDRMTRDDGWRLLSVGRHVERLNTLCYALGARPRTRAARSDEGFELLLRLFDSMITFRARYQRRREMLPLLDLLVFDTDNPRALAWVVRTLRDRLRKLARHDGAWAYEVTDPLPAPETWSIDEMARLVARGQARGADRTRCTAWWPRCSSCRTRSAITCSRTSRARIARCGNDERIAPATPPLAQRHAARAPPHALRIRRAGRTGAPPGAPAAARHTVAGGVELAPGGGPEADASAAIDASTTCSATGATASATHACTTGSRCCRRSRPS